MAMVQNFTNDFPAAQAQRAKSAEALQKAARFNQLDQEFNDPGRPGLNNGGYGTGYTGLAPNDQAGYTQMLKDRQEYQQMKSGTPLTFRYGGELGDQPTAADDVALDNAKRQKAASLVALQQGIAG